MRPLASLRSLSLRGKVVLTVLVAALAALGASTYLSFRFWSGEALATTEQQALLAAGSTRATVESGLRLGRPEPARHSLRRLLDEGVITAARVYGPGRTILLSADPFEEGSRASAIWIPDAAELPTEGVVNAHGDGSRVRAFVPLSLPQPAVLEIEFSVAATKAAMDRGARLGIGLMAMSLVAVGVIVVTMFEREVVAPLHRMDVMLQADPSVRSPAGNRDELRHLEDSVTRLLEMGHEAEARAANQAGLAEVGELAAEMAHEFKRPLASIRTAVDVLQQEYSLDDGGRFVLDTVDGQLERLHETMQDLFSLAKPIVPEAVAVNLVDVLDEALAEIAGRPGSERVRVELAYEREPVDVTGDARRLRQAFVNVMTNALEAMPGGGVLTVSLERAAHSAEVAIADTGAGLQPSEVEQILKPFYSTKPQGTGLGLPLVARVVAAHCGGLAIESQPGAGTTVRITLPLERRSATREA